MVVSGQLVTEMVPENGVRPIRNTVNAFEMTPFYQGSVHHQFNPQCEDAVFVAAFTAEDFGTGQVVNEVFELDQSAIVDTFAGSFNGDMVAAIKDKLPKSIVLGVETCLKTCGEQRGGPTGEDENNNNAEVEGQSGNEGEEVNEGEGEVGDDTGDDAAFDVTGGIGGDATEELGGEVGGDISGESAVDWPLPTDIVNVPEGQGPSGDPDDVSEYEEDEDDDDASESTTTNLPTASSTD